MEFKSCSSEDPVKHCAHIADLQVEETGLCLDCWQHECIWKIDMP